MSFLLRLCLGLFLLAPSLVHAASLDIPSEGDKLSGIGLISGWKCEADGEITITFYTEDSDGNLVAAGDPISTTYGASRTDTSPSCGNDDGNNGFYALWNWAILGDGEHTAVASDNGVEFARNTFTVTTAGTQFLVGASKQVTVPDFPESGDTTLLEWNQSTQHFEMVGRTPATDLGSCVEELIVDTEEMCSGSLTIAGSTISYTFTVNADGQACIAGTGVAAIDGCHAASLPAALEQLGVAVTRNADGSWTINSLPSSGLVDLGMCRVGLTVQPGAMCSGSLDTAIGQIDYTFTVNDEGEACIDETNLVDACYPTSLPDVVVGLGVDVTRNADGSWTINDLPSS